MQWRNGGKVPEVGKDSGRIDRSLWGRMWREKVNSWIVASSQFPRTAIIRLSLVYTLNTLLWLWTPAFSAVLHTHTHTHTGAVSTPASHPCVLPDSWRVSGSEVSLSLADPCTSCLNWIPCRPEVFVNHCLHYLLCINLQKFAPTKNSKGPLTLKMQMGGIHWHWTAPADAVVYYPLYARMVVCLFWRQNLF